MSFLQKLTRGLLANGQRLMATPQTFAFQRNFHLINRSAVATAPLNVISNNCITASQQTGLQRLLTPFCSLLNQVAGFKVKGRLKRRCKDCYFVIRQQRHYVICPTHPRHKQMSMKKRDYKSWILTHATQSKERGY